MITVQHFIGIVILLCVLALAGFSTQKKRAGIAHFVGIVCACYAAMAAFFGIFWCLAQIGVWLRQAMQWVIEAILFPILYFL